MVFHSHQIIYDEYIVRYCERIGATPTPSTLDAIRKQIPIEQCRMTAAWKSRGWNADCINVQVLAFVETYYRTVRILMGPYIECVMNTMLVSVAEPCWLTVLHNSIQMFR